MNLKNVEIFRTWLIRQLEPVCKANPESVSKYVCALLKKDRNDGSLKERLTSQLDIFLNTTTEEFVDFLVDVLKDDKYLLNNVNFRSAPTTTTTVDAIKSKSDDDTEPVTTEIIRSTTENSTTVIGEKTKEGRKSPSPIQAPTPSPPRKAGFQRSFSPRSRRARFRNERRRVPPPQRRGGPGKRDSSHSDSPGPERSGGRPSVVNRKRSASASSESSTKSPRRSWNASRSQSDAKKYKRRHFSSRTSPIGPRCSRSPSPKARRRKPANGNFRKRPLPASRSNSEDERSSGNVIVKRLMEYVNDLPELRPPGDTSSPPPQVAGKKQRCIDFEGKGYCARGDMCPFDHGPSPIVLDNSMLNGIVPLSGATSRPPPPGLHNAPSAFPDANLYTPQYVNMSFPPPQPPPPGVGSVKPPAPARELIAVPTVSLPPKSKHGYAGGKPSYGHVFSSLPPGVSQTTIELTNVPQESNNILDLYESFSKFGNITLVQARRNGDANTALLSFTNATEAALAFTNADSAMPNVKAAWYADKCILKPFPRKSIPASGQTNAKSYVLNRTKISPIATTAPVKSKTPTATTKVTLPGQIEAIVPAELDNTAGISVGGEEQSAKEEGERPCPDRLLTELIKKKRELLEKQLASRKEIVDKMKSLEAGSKEEKTWREVLKKLNDVIAENENSIKVSLQQRKEYLQKLNILPMDFSSFRNLKAKEAAAEQKNQSRMKLPNSQQAVNSSNVVTSANKEGDDSEVDVSDAVDDGIFEIDCDLSILNKELDEEEEVENEPKTTTKSSSQETPKSEENTPSPPKVEYTRVVVSGFENGDEDDLLQHFSQFGNILDKDFDNTIPSATLIYDNRKSAEDARREGRNFQDRLLSVTVFGGKKYQPLVRRTASFKPQYEKEYSSPFGQQYALGSGAGGNPYKYKNPQIGRQATTTTQQRLPLSSPHSRSVYSLRTEPAKNRTVTWKAPTSASSSLKVTPDSSSLKLSDDDDQEFISLLEKDELDS